MKKLNYKVGALKRKFKITDDFQPGELISKVNEQKAIKSKEKQSPKTQIEVMGLV